MRKGARGRESKNHVDILAWLILFSHLISLSHATNSLALSGTLSRTQTLVSSNGIFALGFFPSSSKGGGVFGFGIWYAQLTSLGFLTVVWVPQRDAKFGKEANLRLGQDGILESFDGGGQQQAVWTSGNSPVRRR